MEAGKSAGGSARGKGVDGEEGARRHGSLAPTSKGQGRKRGLADIKGRVGDQESDGAPEMGSAGMVGKAGRAEGRARLRAKAVTPRVGRSA